MSSLGILEVIIGLVFFYLLISLLVTIMNEWISHIGSLRSTNLKKGIQRLLEDENMTGLAKKVYDHQMIKGLSLKNAKPSYISGKSFARVLVDVIDPHAKSVENSKAAVNSFVGAMKKADIPDELRGTLTLVMNHSVDSIDAVHENIQNWFDDAMDRVSGWYKRRMRYISLLLSVLLAFALNANTFEIGGKLWHDQSFRQVVANLASDVTEGCKGQEISTCIEIKNVKLIEGNLRSFPLGFHGKETDKTGIQNSSSHILLNFLGCLVTGLAISLGAPFWFDILSKLNSIRASGNKPKNGEEK